MDINSLMNSEPAGAREQPRRTASQASPPPPPHPAPPPPPAHAQHQQQHPPHPQQHTSHAQQHQRYAAPPQHQQSPYPQHHHPQSLARAHSEQHSPLQHNRPLPPHYQHPGQPQPPAQSQPLRHPSQHTNQYPPAHPYHASPSPGGPHPHHPEGAGRTPGYPPPPPSIDTRSPSFSHPSAGQHHTPARTPQITTPGPGQPGPGTPVAYPFPHQQYQSPVQTHPNRTLDRVHASTPIRSVSQPYGAPHAQSPAGYPPAPPSATHSNASATPPSNYTRSPHLVRESSSSASHPLSANPYGQPQHPSQPGTPLGPPPPQLSRDRAIPHRIDGPTHPSAQHHRTHSGASASPVPPQRSASQVVESTSPYVQPEPQLKRRSTESIPQRLEREHSVSVSPKTQVDRRHPSIDHRRSSQDAWPTPGPGHLQQQESNPRGPSQSQPSSQIGSVIRSSIAQGEPSPRSQSYSISAENNRQQPQYRSDVSQHRSREVSMDNNSSPHITTHSQTRDFQHKLQPEIAPVAQSQISEPRPMVLQQPISHPMNGMAAEPTAPLKRRAEEPPAIEQEQKKLKIQYPEPPPWARLHPSNPGFQSQAAKYPKFQDPAYMPAAPIRNNTRPPSRPGPVPESGQGQPVNIASDSDSKKAQISSILGMPWELSLKNEIPADRLLHQIATFLYVAMLSDPELGAGDARNGSLEIEAKVGTLVDKNTDERLSLPVTTPCVLDEGFSKNRVRFESFMTENQHKSFNNVLNSFITSSMQDGRVQMQYKHRYEMDAFADLSVTGRAALPASAKRELARHKQPGSLRLRTTTDNNPKLKSGPGGPKPVLAQMVKLRLADRDIFFPGEPYDVRISVNIEIDFHGRQDVDPSLLAVTDPKTPPPRPRYKDRLSYKHLVSSIDLTQVSYDGAGGNVDGEKTHELEVELASDVLRGQALLLKEGKVNAFEAVVEKFWNDVVLLVRVREEPVPPAPA